MTDKPTAASTRPSTSEMPDGDRQIVRDETFSRAVVDDIVPLFLGRDVELCCLQFSPKINGMIDKGSYWEHDADPVYAEVARIRISFGEAVEVAMAILQEGIIAGRVKGDRVAQSIIEWTSERAVGVSGVARSEKERAGEV